MKRILFFLPFLWLLGSCGPSGDVNSISWLVGTWEGHDVKSDFLFHETWSREGTNSLSGFSFISTTDGDTVFKENLRIDHAEGGLYYIVNLPDNKGPVLFRLIKGDDKNAVFENLEHDFPKRISYLRQTANTVEVKLEGIEKGQPKVETLLFERDVDTTLQKN
ncbi:MAG TPA: DUF6265 family protein [Bacteroidia bacterium]|nr:DUF6265 family protein [Bacteroidia bacterium]